MRAKDNVPYNPLDYSAPVPPIDKTDVYVTEIELLIHNPYAFYAKHISYSFLKISYSLTKMKYTHYIITQWPYSQAFHALHLPAFRCIIPAYMTRRPGEGRKYMYE